MGMKNRGNYSWGRRIGGFTDGEEGLGDFYSLGRRVEGFTVGEEGLWYLLLEKYVGLEAI